MERRGQLNRWPFRTAQERFEEKFIPEPNSGCWLWTAFVHQDGYGFYNTGDKTYPMKRAHRVSWSIYRGPVPDGLWVLHRCDVRCCVNPEHLFLGTRQDNVDDMEAKGRAVHPRGEQLSSKLTEDDVRAIRADPRKQAEIAAIYGITQVRVSQIKLRKAWCHVP